MRLSERAPRVLLALLPCCGFKCLASALQLLLLIMHGLQGNKPRWCWHTARKGSALNYGLKLNLEMETAMQMEMGTQTEWEMLPRSRWSGLQLSHGRMEISAAGARRNCVFVMCVIMLREKKMKLEIFIIWTWAEIQIKSYTISCLVKIKNGLIYVFSLCAKI